MKKIFLFIINFFLVFNFYGQWSTVSEDHFDDFDTGFTQNGFSQQGYGAESGGSDDKCAYVKDPATSHYVSKSITLESGYIYRFSYYAKRKNTATCKLQLKYDASSGTGGTAVSQEFTPPKRSGTEAGDNYVSDEINGDGNTYYLKIVVTEGGSNVKLRVDGFKVERKAADNNDTDSYATGDGVTQPSGGNIASTVDSPSEAVSVFTMDIYDPGTDDGEPTKITNIRLKPYTTNTADWTDNIQGFVITDLDGNTVTPASVDITDDYVDFGFNAGDLEVPDGDIIELTFAVYLNTSGIQDNAVLSFMVDADDHGFTADASGSDFDDTFPDGDFHSNDFSISVDFSELRFIQQPTDVNVNEAMSPAVQVALTDENGNIDKDADGSGYSIGLTTTGSFSSSATTEADAVQGVATFDNLIFDTAADDITLTTTDPDDWGWTNITSDAFDVTVSASGCASELIFSEYVEGSSNNKYLEIYNGTGQDVDLSDYEIRAYFNGHTDVDATLSLSGTLADGATYVIENDDEELNVDADLSTNSSVMNFNGNDAIELYNTATGQSVDIFGKIGDDSVWGSGDTSSENHTLRRKPDITSGDTDGSDAFDPATEWDGYDQNNVDDLGQHTMNCGPQLNVSAGTLTGFSYVEGNGPSSSQNFTLSGTNLDGSDVSLSAPTDYEISEDDNTYVSSITLSSYDGADKTIYVRLKEGLSAGDYNNETLNISGGGDDDGAEVILSGTVEEAYAEIRITGNGTEIVNGDDTPSASEGTDFGSAEANAGSVTRTFTIYNDGNSDLNLDGNPIVDISGADAGDFSVSADPSTPVEAGQSTTFQITFSPSATGTRTATVSISNNDSDEDPYSFDIQGTGTYSTASDIVENSGFSYTSNIEYINYQGDPITNTSHSVGVFKFDIRDGGANGDSDDKGTELTSITFTLSNPSHIAFIRSAALFDGNEMKENSPSIDTGNGTISFSGLSGEDFTAPDDDVKSLTLRVSFNTTVTDNEQLQFTITSATAGSDGSTFAQADAGGAQSSVTNDRNRLEVVADRIRFTVQPQDGVINTNLDPFTVSALDANGNKDLDATNDVTLSTSGTGMSDSSPYTMSNGDAVISDVQFDTAQSDITITATTTDLDADNDDESEPFDILDVPDGSYRTTSDGTWKDDGTGTADWEEFTGGSWQAMDDQPSGDTDHKVYIRHNIELQGTNTASDIVIEDGGYLNTNGVSQTITKLLVMSGGTYFKNSNGMKVADGGEIEVLDGGTFIFKHSNSTSLSSNLWNGTEKFHAGSNFIVKQSDTNVDYLFMESPDDVSDYDGGQFGNIIIDLDQDKLLILPDNYTGTLTKGDLIIKTITDNIKFTETDATCTIGGNLEIQSSVDHDITITTKDQTVTLNIQGDFIHSGSEDFRLANSNGIDPNITMNVNGNIILNGTGSLRPDISSHGTGTNEINLKGDLTVGSDAALYSENELSTINFTGTGDGLTDATTQTIDIATSDDAIENKNIQFNVTEGAYVKLIQQNLELGENGTLSVKDGGVLDFGFNGNTALIVTKSGSQTGTGFDLDAGGYLKITSPDGLWEDSSAGNVQVVASNTSISTLATFHYIGKEDQVTGDGLGTSSNGRAVIVELVDNSLTLTPSVSFGITDASNTHINDGNGGILEIRKGKFIETDSEYITGSTGGLKMEAGTLYKIVKNSEDTDDYLPRMQGLNNEYELNGGTIELAGDGDQILRGGRDYRSLTFSNDGTKTVSSAITSIQGEIYITDNATLDVEEHTMGGAGTDLIMDTNGIYRTAGTGTKPDAQGSYLLADNSKVVFTNSSAADWQLIRLNRDFQHIEIEGTNVGNGSTVTGISLNAGGTFTVKDHAVFKLKNTDGFTGSTSTAVSSANNPTVTAEPDATIEYAGDNQTITDFEYPYLKISGSGIKNLGASEIRVNKDLNIVSSQLHIEDDKGISIANNVTNEGEIVVENKGNFVQTDDNGSIGGSGTFRVNKTTRPLSHYWDFVYWSSPINSNALTLGSVISNAWGYYTFDPTQQDPTQDVDPGWQEKQSSDVFPIGYGVAISAPPSSDFTAGPVSTSFIHANDPFNNGDIAVNIVVNGNGAEGDNDWNFIGNPYPSALNFDSLATYNTMIQGTYYAWTNCAGLSNGLQQEAGYATYNLTGGVAACSGNGSLVPTAYIPSGSAFMLEGNSAGSLHFRNAYRSTGHNDNTFNRMQERDRIWFDLTADGEGLYSQILVGFMSGATDNRDRLYDGRALHGGSAGIYTLIDTIPMTIQGLRSLDGETRYVEGGVYSNARRRLSLQIYRAEGILDTLPVYVMDHQTQVLHNLRDGAYEFQTDAGDFPGRFTFIFGYRPLKVTENAADDIRLVSRDGIFTLEAPVEMERITVFDLQGRQVYDKHLNKRHARVDLSRLAPQPLLFHIRLSGGKTAVIKTLR